MGNVLQISSPTQQSPPLEPEHHLPDIKKGDVYWEPWHPTKTLEHVASHSSPISPAATSNDSFSRLFPTGSVSIPLANMRTIPPRPEDGVRPLRLTFDTLSTFTIGLIGFTCKAFVFGLNSYKFDGVEEKLWPLVRHPELRDGRALVTVSNHISTLDDPMIIASITPTDVMLDPLRVRHVLCAEDICYNSTLVASFFDSVKCFPVNRRGGVEQPEMVAPIEKLKSGGWIHLFPEGRVSQSGRMLPSKRGVGRLLLDVSIDEVDPAKQPIVLPFFHWGAHEIRPLRTAMPRPGKFVKVVMGEPIVFDKLIQLYKEGKVDRKNFQDLVARAIDVKMEELRVRASQLH